MTFIFRWLLIDYSTKIRPFFDLPKGFENIFKKNPIIIK